MTKSRLQVVYSVSANSLFSLEEEMYDAKEMFPRLALLEKCTVDTPGTHRFLLHVHMEYAGDEM